MNKKFSIAPCTKKIMPVLLAAAFLLPLSAQAEIKAGSVEISPFVGYNFFENKQNIKDRPVFGGRLGYNITNRFGLEGTMEFIETRVDDQSLGFTREGQFASPTSRVKMGAYHLDLLYHFLPESNFNPFIVAGYGAARYSPKIHDKHMSAFNFGVGAKYWVSDNIALRFDLRDNMVSEVFNHNYHNISATAGLVFRFGGKSHAAPAPVAQAEPKPAEKVIIVVAEEPEPVVEEKVKTIAAAPKVEEKVVILAFEDIHFDFDKATLNPEAKRVLKSTVQTLKDNPKAKIRIAGYTSAAGTKEYNQTLSERRANSVRDYLIEEGVLTPERIATIGYGQTRPAQHEAAPQDLYSKAAKANMRVLFEIVVK
jgi:OmpA-OmpF porin, OOP family